MGSNTAEYTRRYEALHRDKIRERKRLYKLSHKEQVNAAARRNYHLIKLTDPDKYNNRRSKSKSYIALHRNEINRRRRVYVSKPENWEKVKRYIAKWRSKKWRDDLNFRISVNLRNRMNTAMKKRRKAGSAVRDLGCTIPEYRQYLQALFSQGMTWDNYGAGKGKWTIDHIKPLSLFDLTDRGQFLQACHYKNTQPMWFDANVRKGNKYLDKSLNL